MERVIVTVKRQGEAQVRDLELPADVEAERLSELIAEALGWATDAAGQPIDFEIEAHPLGRKLKADESLETAGVWDGSWLVMQPVGGAAQPGTQPPTEQPPAGGPVSGWRDLGLDLPDSTFQDAERGGESAPGGKKRESGFVWKQID